MAGAGRPSLPLVVAWHGWLWWPWVVAASASPGSASLRPLLVSSVPRAWARSYSVAPSPRVVSVLWPLPPRERGVAPPFSHCAIARLNGSACARFLAHAGCSTCLRHPLASRQAGGDPSADLSSLLCHHGCWTHTFNSTWWSHLGSICLARRFAV
jgi:hypothetical protein